MFTFAELTARAAAGDAAVAGELERALYAVAVAGDEGFAATQDGFAGNLAFHVSLMMRSDLDTATTLSCLRCLQGLVLLHGASREVFALPGHMEVLVSRLDVAQGEVAAECLTTLIHVLCRSTANFRQFERLGGPRRLIDMLLALLEEQLLLKFKVLEFLIFYLVDETKKGAAGRKRRAQKRAELEAINPDIRDFIARISELDAFQEVAW